MADTIEYDGTEQSFADWGISLTSIQQVRRPGAEGVFSFNVTVASVAAEAASPRFAFEAQIIVRVNRTWNVESETWSGGTIKFAGKRVTAPMRAAGESQAVTYRFADAWYDLSHTHYQQTWQGYGETFIAPELVLFTWIPPVGQQVALTVGDQIQHILQTLLDFYDDQGMDAPFRYVGRDLNDGEFDPEQEVNAGSTIEPSLFDLGFPSYIGKPMMCSDALMKCTQLLPRINYWFDFTTSPPTFHATFVDTMSAVTLALFDGATHKQLAITKREDLRPRAVVIIYRITTTVDSESQISYVVDKWGPHGGNSGSDPNAGLRVVTELIDLQGANISVVKGHLDVEPVKALAANGGTTQALKRAWWASERGGEMAKLKDSRARFQDKDGNQTTIPDATFIDAATGATLSVNDLKSAGLVDINGNLMLNRLVRGSHSSWMIRTDAQPVVSLKLKVAAKMEFCEYDAESVSGTPDTDTAGRRLRHGKAHEAHSNIEVTNGTTGDYSTVSTVEAGESYTTGANGIAKYLWDHLNADQYDGEVVRVQANFDDSGASTFLTLGKKLNLSGGASAWAAMNAQIQEITENYGFRETTVRIGVAAHLSAGDLSSLNNMWHQRRNWFNPRVRSDNTASNGEVDGGVTNGQSNTVDGVVENGQVAVHGAEDSGNKVAIEMNGSDGKIALHTTDSTGADVLTSATGRVIVSQGDLAGQDVKLRWKPSCDAEGNPGYTLVLAGPQVAALPDGASVS